ncbi:MAG: hypothetical protein ACFB5Z_12910 [Elainellaceae cyanobacterium]
MMSALANGDRAQEKPSAPTPQDDPYSGAMTPLQARFEKRIKDETGFSMQGHEQSEGPILMSQSGNEQPIDHEPQRCPANAPVKTYDVLAVNVNMVLNRWGDRDPQGHMYVLRDRLGAVRSQEAAAASDAMPNPFDLTLGLGADPIQPLTIRANVGDCVKISFENALEKPNGLLRNGAPASFHIHGADLILASSGEPALASNPESMALPGASVDYEWFIDDRYYNEHTFRIQSHGPKGRYQVSHGLFGGFIVEPQGSQYFDPRTGANLCTTSGAGQVLCQNSWDAMIDPGDGSADFREFGLMYHEIGNDGFLPSNKAGELNPFIDAITESYQPNGRAINYRSESFYRRMGEAEVMAKLLDLKPDSPLKEGPNQAYSFQDPQAAGIWKKIDQGLRGELNNFADESQAYGTYAFGEPPTPVPQSYVGDPIKFRIIHGGSETFHVPHLHGGGIQWQRQPEVGKSTSNPDYTPIDAGLKKQFTQRMPSSGNDSQSIGPSETYDFEIACGSGGCQQTVGDFLFHCHVASHYVSGMWHFWRVYNTLQNTDGKTDDLPVLAELPDRQNQVQPAVNSLGLIDKIVDFAGDTISVTKENLPDLAEVQLPPQGEAKTWQDASVMNWAIEEQFDGRPLYKNEPETYHIWPNFQSPTPGQRPDILFDSRTGKLAYPLLRPHLGKRPPFAPHHGPAPFLEPRVASRGEPAAPGTNGAQSLCPVDAPRRTYKLHAIQTPIQVTDRDLDKKGMIFVVKEHEEQARTTDEFKVPLAMRANQGDCVDIILVNELEETGELAELSKTNIHIHFVQFDTQSSDGVISGSSYEQAPRPFRDAGMSATVQEAVASSESSVRVNDASLFQPGTTVAVGVDQKTDGFETAIVASASPSTGIVSFTEPLQHSHGAGQLITNEFVRYRWYVARQNGAIYFHDHVDALKRWGHGLFGALIAEPTNSEWRHPRTGETFPERRSGPIMDILVDAQQEVVPGLNGSFREYALFFTDRTTTENAPPNLSSPLASTDTCTVADCGTRRTTTGTINLRAEPLDASTDRGQGAAQLMLSSSEYGDPKTPILRSYVGDPLMFRLLTTATEEVHPFHITGHHFRWERFQENSPPLTTFGVGISERFNAFVKAAGGAARQAGDYLYQNGTFRHFLEGNWGILRVHDQLQDDLLPLPGHEPSAIAAAPVCPVDAPVRQFAVSAIERRPLFNDQGATSATEADLAGYAYVLDQDLAFGDQGNLDLTASQPLNPLVLRANAGDCLEVTLTNRLQNDSHVSFHLDMAAFNPQDSLGINLGNNPMQTVPPNGNRTYRYYAESELGAMLLRDFGDPKAHLQKGLYGAVIIEPAGSTYLDPRTGAAIASGVEAVISTPDEPDFREFVTLFHDADPILGTFNMPYNGEVRQLSVVNYRAEPFRERLGRKLSLDEGAYTSAQQLDDSRRVFADEASMGGAPITEVFEAYTGDPVRFRVISAFSEQPQMFSVEGHLWPLTPGIEGSTDVSTRYLPSSGVLNAHLKNGVDGQGGAGGPQGRPGDYLWGNDRLPYQKVGQWGLMRVHAQGTEAEILPLPDRQSRPEAG